MTSVSEPDPAAATSAAPKKASSLWAVATAELRARADTWQTDPERWSQLPAELVATGPIPGDGAAELRRVAADLVRWNRLPPLDPRERSAWVPVDPPVPVRSGPASPIRSLKLKGIGLGTTGGPTQPAAEPYNDALRHAHVGITDDGDFCLRYSERAPLGGMFLDRARMEYDNAALLQRAGCPSTVPVALFRYESLECPWQPGRPLGVVVSGGPTEEPLRACGLMVADPGDPTIYGRACAEILRLWGPDRGSALRAVAFEVGRTLRQFHEAGLFRHNGYPTNYLLDPRTRRICLLDLDSSLPLAEFPEPRRAMEILRDVAGAVFSLGLIFFEPSIAERFPPDELAATGHFQRLLDGYFGAAALPPAILDAFLDHVFGRYEQLYRRRQEIRDAPDGDAVLRGLWPDRCFCYPTVVAALGTAYTESALHRRFPLRFPPAELTARARSFVRHGAPAEW
ncbi:hypothetical protein SAMN05216266_1045 [Amycolatopsis marina]|uniref:Protein kinase domain-containing protein n=1 Tax=Amycolatopsis marina TaxID=490629 RepID=A0A1I0XTX2_9PSEU|nr:hypothetical protein [Amycolatopsis marina]SFB04525.1 hypothetical protein SAMN05216266_1045 [Amycolatopsis marina]